MPPPLNVQKTGPSTYLVTGGAEPHWVNPSAADQCDCGHYLWRGSDCKHLRAVRAYIREQKGAA